MGPPPTYPNWYRLVSIISAGLVLTLVALSLACYAWGLHSGFRTQQLDRTIAEDYPETLTAASEERQPEGV